MKSLSPPLSLLHRFTPGRGAWAALILGLILGLGSAASAQEQGGGAEEGVERPGEGGLVPAAFWSPMAGRAMRSDVVVELASAEGAPVARVINNNLFPVRVHDLTMLIERKDGSWRLGVSSTQQTLAPGEAQEVTLEVRDEGASMALAALGERRVSSMLLHRVRFGLTLAPDALAVFGQLGSAETTDAERINARMLLILMRRFVEVEEEAAHNTGYARAELERSRVALRGLAPAIGRDACEAQRREVERALEIGGEAAREQIGQVAWMAEREREGQPWLECFDQATWGRVVQGADAAGEEERAAALARRFDRGEATAEPFRGVLIEESERRLLVALNRIATSSRDHADTIVVDGYKAAFDALHDLQRREPGHAGLSARQGLSERVVEAIEVAVDEHAYERAGMLLVILEGEAAVGGPASQERFEQMSGMLAYEQGRFWFHHRRGSEQGRAQARALFEQGRGYAPLRSTLYTFGLYFVEYQFTSIFGLLGLVALVVLAGRSRWWLRARMRLALWGARRRASRGDHREAMERFWRVLTRMLGVDAPRPSDRRITALAASGVLGAAEEIGDPHEAHEARAFLARVEPSLRPASWRDANALLGELASRCRGRLDVETRRALRARAEAIEGLFTGDAVRTARALAAEIEARGAELSEAERATAYHRAQEAWQVAATHSRVESAQVALQRMGLLAATLGPAVEGEEAWRRAWCALAVVPDEGRPALRRARVMAAAIAAPTAAAVRVLEQAAPAMAAAGEGRVLAAALYEAALRAELPLGEDASALLELALLDNLLTEHGGGTTQALDARLRLAILRRLGGVATAQSGCDVEQGEDCAALLAAAERQRARPTTRGLAAVLDLLTPGDHGFDAWAEGAGGEDGVLFTLLVALDHYAAGRVVEAAAQLAGADPEATGVSAGRKARLYAARATVAAALGQSRAALGALDRACALLDRERLDDAGFAVVRRAAARLLPLALGHLDAAELGASSLDAGARGLMAEPWHAEGALSWHRLGRVLAERASFEVAFEVLVRSQQEEAGAEASRERAAAWATLGRRALGASDYARARMCAILQSEPDAADVSG